RSADPARCAGRGAQHRPATRRTRASRPRGGRVSRHARRGTQGGQDWGSGEYPEDSETDLGPGGDYPSQPGWGQEPPPRADPRAFPVPGEPYPPRPDPGGGHSDAYRWAPDPLAAARPGAAMAAAAVGRTAVVVDGTARPGAIPGPAALGGRALGSRPLGRPG